MRFEGDKNSEHKCQQNTRSASWDDGLIRNILRFVVSPFFLFRTIPMVLSRF
jgi:hypothetical protein